ncbi:B3 domain-containing transcription factor VRN1-like [Nymphaea colorata]|nr:B3 domain-containing transcription factor VRN1-like [Nymphaea colorata]XP_049933083.1 B3 domain-containing transcription factor VRN1-like [Nymphaea colorata]XP_049933084.1 B3 domain-containing transcription factor VRN1-like [Nymphaea colorata]
MELCADCRKWAPGTKREFFIKVLLGRQLWIPPSFYNYIGDKLNRIALLTGPSGMTCTVQLAKINNRLCFKDGWRTFAEENSFKEEALLLFAYDGEVSFSVEVFSNTACQSGGRQDKVNEGGSCSNHMIINIKTEEEEEKEEEGDDEEEGQEEEDEEEEGEEEEEELSDTSCESKEDHFSSEEMHGGETKGKKPENAARKQKYTKYFISRRRPVSREEKRKAFRAVASMGSPFPSSIVIMKPTCVCKGFYVNIPVDFLRAHDILGETRTIKVQNVEGRERPVRLLRRGDRGGLESGWSDFVYDNNLEEGDVCAFELINNKKKMLILKVIIFRVVEETTPLKLSRTGRS